MHGLGFLKPFVPRFDTDLLSTRHESPSPALRVLAPLLVARGCPGSWEVAVNVFAVVSAHEGHRAALKHKADPVIAQVAKTQLTSRKDARRERKLFSGVSRALCLGGLARARAAGFETFEIGNLLEGLRGLDLQDDFLDPP